MTQPLLWGVGSPFDTICRRDSDGAEYWSARELMPLYGYEKWQKFEDAIERAKLTAANSGVDVASAFRQISQLTGAGNLGDLRRYDYQLSRYASYLVAMNGDPRKSEIAAAQTYFAIKTREAETRPATSFEVPGTYAEALRAAADAAERAELAEAKVAELEPAAQAWDALADAHGDYSVRDAAQILDRDPLISTGQNRLFATLRTLRWIDAEGRPYQAQVDAGRLVRRPTSYTHPHTHEPVLTSQLRITVKGLAELHRRLGGSGTVEQLLDATGAVR